VSNEHPSEVMPLQWPEVSGGSLTGTNHPAVQLGVSLEPLGEIRPSFCGSWKHPSRINIHPWMQHSSRHLSNLGPGALTCPFAQDPLLESYNLALYSHPGCAVRDLHNGVVGDRIYM